MAIRINIASAFEGGIPLSERDYLSDVNTDSEPAQKPSSLDPVQVTDLTGKIFDEIRLKLVPKGSPPVPLHPSLKAALAHDTRNLASYLLRSTGSESRGLLTLKSIFDLRFQLAAQLPTSEYEPFLMTKGYDDVMARILANLALRMGRQIAEVARCRRKVVEAIRALSDPQSRKRTLKKMAMFLLEASRNCSALETIFYEVDRSPDEFIRYLRAIVANREIDRERIADIVLEISLALKTPRGPKPTAASATHEFLLQQLGCAYTWDDADGNFRDPLTKAARGQFSDPRFSPRAAQRRVNARRRSSS
jgi:hypothetical protein